MNTPPPDSNPQPFDSVTLFVSLFALASVIILSMFLLNYCVFRHSNSTSRHVNSTTPFNIVQNENHPDILINMDHALESFPITVYNKTKGNDIIQNSNISESDIALHYLEANIRARSISELTLSEECCSICLASFEDEQEVRILPCLHQFHSMVMNNMWDQSTSVSSDGSKFNLNARFARQIIRILLSKTMTSVLNNLIKFAALTSYYLLGAQEMSTNATELSEMTSRLEPSEELQAPISHAILYSLLPVFSIVGTYVRIFSTLLFSFKGRLAIRIPLIHRRNVTFRRYPSNYWLLHNGSEKQT